MSEQVPESAPVPQPLDPNETGRFPLAWVLLIGLFLFLIAGQLLGAKQESASNIDSIGLESQLKFSTIAREFAQSSTSGKQEPQKEILKQIEDIHRQASKGVGKDPVASRLVLVTGKQLGKPADEKALKQLETSKSQADKAIARIYGDQPVTREWISESKSSFPKTFLGKIVMADALEKAGSPPTKGKYRGDALIAGLVFLTGLLVVAAGVLVIIWVAISYFSGQIKPIGHPYQGLTKADADRLAFRFSIFFLLLATLPIPLRFVLKGANWALASVIYELVVLGAFLWLCRQPVLGKSDPPRKVIGRTQPWWKLVGIGIAGFAANLPIVFVLAIVFSAVFSGLPAPTHPLSEQMGLGADPLTLAFMFVTASIMAPIMEEFSFRGLLFPALTGYVRPLFAMLLTGFTFAAIHPQGPALWAALGAIGTVASALTYFTGSLVPAMVMHACHNTAILALSLVLLY